MRNNIDVKILLIYSINEIINLLGDERTVERSIADIINCIASFLIDKTGNEILDK